MEDFRFEKFSIWKDAMEISDKLFDIAETADKFRFFRFGEQLRGAALSITNNIAEGSGSSSDKEFASFLNISRRSVFECVNILHVFERRKIIDSAMRISLYPNLAQLSRQITNLRKSLI